MDVITTAIPEPATYQNVLDHYTKLLRDNPRIKLLLLTHISHRTQGVDLGNFPHGR